MAILYPKVASIGVLLATLLSSQESVEGLTATPSAFGVGNAGFKGFLSQLPPNFNAVNEGGWFALQKRYVSEVGNENFHKFKSSLPKDIDVVAVGGYDNLIKLAADPKAELVTIIKNNLLSSGGKVDYNVNGKIDALVALLQSQGKGFNSVAVDGEWAPVLSRQGKKKCSAAENYQQKGKGNESSIKLSCQGDGVRKPELYPS